MEKPVSPLQDLEGVVGLLVLIGSILLVVIGVPVIGNIALSSAKVRGFLALVFCVGVGMWLIAQAGPYMSKPFSVVPEWNKVWVESPGGMRDVPGGPPWQHQERWVQWPGGQIYERREPNLSEDIMYTLSWLFWIRPASRAFLGFMLILGGIGGAWYEWLPKKARTQNKAPG